MELTLPSGAVALALVAANIRKILTFIREQLARVPVTSKNKDFADRYYSGAELPTATIPVGYPLPPDR